MLTVLSAVVTSASCGGRDCEPPPSSSDLAVGDSTEVEIEIVDGGWSPLDVAGVYWSTDVPVPGGLPSNGRVAGVATLVSGDGDTPEDLTSGSLTLELAGGEVVAFEGPIFCN